LGVNSVHKLTQTHGGGSKMKTTKIKIAAAVALFFVFNTGFAQRDRNGRNGRDYRDENYDNRNNNNDHSGNEYDRNDDDRISDYERGRNDYRRNPYDYRNLPRDWDRQRSDRFDWYRFDWDNRYDPRFGNRDYYDLYFPWDPNNPYDIRNQRNYYSNRQYWNGGRPNRIVIVPPIIRYGHPAWAYRNKGGMRHGNEW
jgi:hypothetical protein